MKKRQTNLKGKLRALLKSKQSKPLKDRVWDLECEVEMIRQWLIEHQTSHN